MNDDCKQDLDPAQPCGFGLFKGRDLLVAFPTEAKAREVLQDCEREGYSTERLELRLVFAAPQPDGGRVAALEAELRQAYAQLAAALRQSDTVVAELVELRDRL